MERDFDNNSSFRVNRRQALLAGLLLLPGGGFLVSALLRRPESSNAPEPNSSSTGFVGPVVPIKESTPTSTSLYFKDGEPINGIQKPVKPTQRPSSIATAAVIPEVFTSSTDQDDNGNDNQNIPDDIPYSKPH